MYCSKCGKKLIVKESINFGVSDGMVPYCTDCAEFRFPMFNCAVSCVIFNNDFTKILLIQQYNKNVNILVAGYVSKSESLEAALEREIMEEVGLKVEKFEFNASRYYEKSDSLICNFIVQVKDENFTIKEEVDSCQWFTIEEAKKEVMKNSLAEKFLLKAIEKISERKAVTGLKS